MNVKELLALAYLTPDEYIEVPEVQVSAGLAGTLVIVSLQPPMGEDEITVSVHNHDDREEAAECFARVKERFDQATAAFFANQLDHTPVNASYFV
jgi:hypothetical protein